MFINFKEPQEVKKEGSTTTSAAILYDILRKLESNATVQLSLLTENKLPKNFGEKRLVSIILFNLDTLPPSSSIKIGYLLS